MEQHRQEASLRSVVDLPTSRMAKFQCRLGLSTPRLLRIVDGYLTYFYDAEFVTGCPELGYWLVWSAQLEYTAGLESQRQKFAVSLLEHEQISGSKCLQVRVDACTLFGADLMMNDSWIDIGAIEPPLRLAVVEVVGCFGMGMDLPTQSADYLPQLAMIIWITQPKTDTEVLMSNIVSELDNLGLESKPADVTLVVSSSEFQVHSTLLGSHSSVFADLLRLSFPPHRFTVTPTEPDTWSALLNYLYSGKLDDAMVPKLLPLANQYAFAELEARCVEKLGKSSMDDT